MSVTSEVIYGARRLRGRSTSASHRPKTRGRSMKVSIPAPLRRIKVTRRRLIVLAIAVAAGLAYWLYTPPLTPAERAIVGRWTMPMVANAPANAVRSVYDLTPGRGLTVVSRTYGGDEAGGAMTGSWRVEDGHLVLDAAEPETRPLGD